MHVLTEATISQILTTLSPSQAHEFLHTLTQALTQSGHSDGTIHQPPRASIATDQSTALFMPVSNTTTTGIKIVTVPRARPIAGVINLFAPDGQLLGLLGAAEITAFRTALATMAMFVRCPEAGIPREHVVVFGSGRQAEWHARLALLLTAPGEIRSVSFVNRGRARLLALEEEVVVPLRKEHPGVTMHTLCHEGMNGTDYNNRLQSILSTSDVIFSCTPATQPNFAYAHLQQSPKRRFLGLIGSYKPEMQEVDTATLLSGGGKVYVDSKEACLIESGELIRAGTTEQQLVEIGEVYGGKPLEQTEGNVVFKCVGMGIMDLVIAKRVLDEAVGRELGMAVEGFS